MIILGIDPGLTGAIGLLGHKGEYLNVADMPTMQRQGASAYVKNQVNAAALEELLRSWLCDYDKNEIHAFVETPIAFPNQHVGTTAACFLTAGLIEGVLSARHYPHTLVRPTEWKKAMGLQAPKGQKSGEAAAKQAARSRAIRYYPEAPLALVKHHNRAEALLIAKYGYERTS